MLQKPDVNDVEVFHPALCYKVSEPSFKTEMKGAESWLYLFEDDATGTYSNHSPCSNQLSSGLQGIDIIRYICRGLGIIEDSGSKLVSCNKTEACSIGVDSNTAMMLPDRWTPVSQALILGFTSLTRHHSPVNPGF